MGLTTSQDREGKATALEIQAAVVGWERDKGQKGRQDPCPCSQDILCPWNSGSHMTGSWVGDREMVPF